MSRTINEVQDSIIAEKETFSELNLLTPAPDSSQDYLKDIQSPSKVSIWRNFTRLIATAIKFHEDLFDAFVLKVEAFALSLIPATSRRLVIIAKQFQFGDELLFVEKTGAFSYADSTSTDAIAKQIITQASVIDANRLVTYKIAKGAVGSLTKLDAAEVTAFNEYLDGTKVSGTKTVTVSEFADFLKLAFTIEYDPLQIKADGSLIDDGTFPIQEAIDAYIQGLDFDSAFRIQELIDAIQQARGAVNVVADVVEARDAVAGYTNIITATTQTYLPFSGYFATVDETGSETVPVYGSINVLTDADYDPSLPYLTGDFARFKDTMYKSNVDIPVPEAFTASKWDTVSNLTFIST